MGELVLVTGGSGYIAGWCVAELLRRGYQVRTTVRGPGPGAGRHRRRVGRRRPGGPAELRRRRPHRRRRLGRRVKGADYVLHVASPLGGGPAGRHGRRGPRRHAAGAARRHRARVKRVVMTSAANAASPSSYATEGVTDETLWTDPDDPALIPYRRSKTLAERAAWDFMDSYTGPTELVTVLPGAVFGPILTTSNIGSVGIVGRMVSGKMRGIPRIGLEVVDVRDLVDVHIRAMTSPEAAGQRFLATGEFMWMRGHGPLLRDGLGADGRKVSTRQVPGRRGPARRPVQGPVAARDHPRPRPPQPSHHREGPARPRLAAPPRPRHHPRLRPQPHRPRRRLGAAVPVRRPDRDVGRLERAVHRARQLGLFMASRSTVWRSRALNEATTASASYRVRLNRRSTACCTRRRSGLNSAAAASVAAATATGAFTGSTLVANSTSPANTPASTAVMIR